MKTNIQIVEVTSMEPAILEELSALLVKVVEDGASVGFLAPLRMQEAREYWQGVMGPDVILWVARSDQRIAGTVQLQLAMKPNATHRAEVCKLMVDPAYRRNGIARSLMCTVKDRAEQEGRSLLVLDTREGDPSNDLYKSLGYIETGRIPRFARSSNGELDGTVLYYQLL